MRRAPRSAPGSGASLPPSDRAAFWATPLRLKLYLVLVAGAALCLPWLLYAPVDAEQPAELTVLALIGVSVLNVEVSRWISGGLAQTQQPHKALSAWAFACALLVPAPWLLVVVPVTYAHTRWRGLRITLWKWVGSGLYLILCGCAAAAIRHAMMGAKSNWMAGDGHEGFQAMVVAGVVFLALETLLFAGSALINHAEDEVWLRAMLTGPGFYVTESGVLLIGGLLSAVWTGGVWYSLLFLPIYILIQHAVLLAPLRERAAVAIELADKNAALAVTNDELEANNQFKVDLIGMLGHELANPLTSVQGYAQIGADAAREGDAAAAAAALEVVERNAEQMRAVLIDILTNVASGQGGLVAAVEECRLRPRLHAAAAALPGQRRPEIECPVELVAVVQPGHLDQILANLLGNAEKYAGGAVRISAAEVDGRIEVVVGDRGPGVTGPFRERLFERYSRDSTTSDGVLGAGLGLYISRELARANGGDLRHRDASPHGSEFVVALRSQ